MIDRQVEQLVRLVDDLLDVSRITGGKIQLRKEPVDVAAVVARAVETSRPLIDAARPRARPSTLPAEPLWVDGRPRRGWRRCWPTCSTTRRSTPSEGGEIALEVEREGGEAVVRVRDNGDRHPARDAPARLRPVHAGRPLARPLAGRPGHRPDAGPPPGRDARRHASRPAATGRAAAASSSSACRPPRPTASARRRGRPGRRRPGRPRPAGRAASWSSTTTRRGRTPRPAARGCPATRSAPPTTARPPSRLSGRDPAGRRPARHRPARHGRLRGGPADPRPPRRGRHRSSWR